MSQLDCQPPMLDFCVVGWLFIRSSMTRRNSTLSATAPGTSYTTSGVANGGRTSGTLFMAAQADRLAFVRAGGTPGRHVAPEGVVDRGRRQGVDEARRHQQLPRRIIGREEVAQCHRQGERRLARQQQE